MLDAIVSSILCADAPCLPDFDQLSADNGEMEDCTRVKSFDYFSGSEAAYILTVFFVLGSVIRKSVLLRSVQIQIFKLLEYSVEFLIEYSTDSGSSYSL